MRGKVTENWRKLHDKEIHNLYFAPPNVMQVTRSRKMRWMELVARSVGRGMHAGFRRGNQEGMKTLGRPKS